MEQNTDLQEQYTAELSPIVEQAEETPLSIALISYNAESITERKNITAADCPEYFSDDMFTWIHVQGQPKPGLLRQFGQLLNLHPMALEDIINIGERAKTEVYDNQIMLILGMLRKEGSQIFSQQVSLFLGQNFLLSFHSGGHDPFRAVRRRLHHPKSALRQRKLDYLFYILIDVILDNCFPILDEFEDEIEQVEQELFGPEGVDTIQNLYTLKRELLVLRLKLRPQREAIRVLMRDNGNFFEEETRIYLRDCYDHIVRLTDILEIYRDMTSNMLDTHLSLVNRQTFNSNEVQRKASVWATLFAPLTFITGIYGMNYINMPETQLVYGYFFCLGGIAILGFILWIIFRFKKWL